MAKVRTASSTSGSSFIFASILAEQLAQSLDKATQESNLKKLADAKLHRDYEDAVTVLERIPQEVLAAYTHRTEKERETAYGR